MDGYLDGQPKREIEFRLLEVKTSLAAVAHAAECSDVTFRHILPNIAPVTCLLVYFLTY